MKHAFENLSTSREESNVCQHDRKVEGRLQIWHRCHEPSSMVALEAYSFSLSCCLESGWAQMNAWTSCNQGNPKPMQRASLQVWPRQKTDDKSQHKTTVLLPSVWNKSVDAGPLEPLRFR
eukprot:4535240-Amphidinium_carterae.1